MIAKGNLHGSGVRLARYLSSAGDNEKAEVAELRGFVYSDIESAFRVTEAIAAGTRCENPFFHVQVRNPKNEVLTRAQWRHVADRIDTKLGFANQPRAMVFHVKDGHEHMHLAYDRIDAEIMKAIDPGLFKNKLKEACRELEKEFGLTRVRNNRGSDSEHDTARVLRSEFEQARRLGTDLREIRSNIRKAWEAASNGSEFVSALNKKDYVLARGDRRDYVIIDEAGGEHALGKRLLGTNAATIREKLSDLNRNDLPNVEEAKKSQVERASKRLVLSNKDENNRRFKSSEFRGKQRHESPSSVIHKIKHQSEFRNAARKFGNNQKIHREFTYSKKATIRNKTSRNISPITSNITPIRIANLWKSARKITCNNSENSVQPIRPNMGYRKTAQSPMCVEQRIDYRAARDGKITWKSYFTKWGKLQL